MGEKNLQPESEPMPELKSQPEPQAETEVKPELQKELEPGEKLEKVSELAARIRRLDATAFGSHGEIWGTEDYTLIEEPIGNSTTENSWMAARQLEFAFALSLHPLVEKFSLLEASRYPVIKEKTDKYEIIRPSEETKKQEERFAREIKKLIESHVMRQLKILDLGCGHSPTFARVARASGANVYTVDLFDLEYGDESEINPQIIKEEIEKHIKLDLNSPQAIETLEHITGGNFDLVTEAHLGTGGTTAAFDKGKKIGWPLLKIGGIYFNANNFQNPKIKDRY